MALAVLVNGVLPLVLHRMTNAIVIAVLVNGALLLVLHQTPTVYRVTKAAFLPLVKGKHRVPSVTTSVRQEPIQRKKQFLLNRNAKLA